ncbi:TetR/AcrR family transcriptional regulator [Epibacterium ulvae]|uniref:TetR/AcrR family transcriptional regulator n=1 Tax=Epibacterium ulvae TaxID=1156985 RepID=UPI00249104A4|nr:TetR/AcrR family transcriptional regulator [Epibacterium ulvae]
MTRAPQQRRLETRAKLINVAHEIIDAEGFSNLRVEDVVQRAGVAKGTLFSHFKDKDGLLAVIVGQQMTQFLDQLEKLPAPANIEALLSYIEPSLNYVASDRVIFDLLLRYSGSISNHSDEVITASFYRQIELCAGWIAALQANGVVRTTHSPALLSEGIQAFLNQVLAIRFCQNTPTSEPALNALRPFIQAWLADETPKPGQD